MTRGADAVLGKPTKTALADAPKQLSQAPVQREENPNRIVLRRSPGA